jgi:hypothetical protein
VPLAAKTYVAKRDAQVAQLNQCKATLAELDKKSPRSADENGRRQTLITQRDKLQSTLLPAPPMAEAAAEGGTPGGLFPGVQDVPIHIRGSYTRLGPIVPRRMPAFFAAGRQPPIVRGSGRREVAGWIASKDNPLTARVIVNRVWQGHFGAGLVATPNNFGLMSEPPTHPALLDWLAVRFVEEGWSLKKLHRQILLSATYGQASGASKSDALARNAAIDPDNRWLGRFAARRMEAEAIRDSMLFAAGRLDPASGGPASDDLAISRRSLYVQTARWDRSTFATLFDAANPDASDERRNVSTVAPQSLFLLNNTFTLAQAKHLAERLVRDVPDDTPQVETVRLQHAYRLLFARLPSEEEISIARQLLAGGEQAATKSAWADVAHVLLCSNEFVYID